jgi:hypothetical protein
MLIYYWEAQGVFDQRLGSCPGLRREADDQTGGEIMPAHAHHMVEKCKHGLLSGLVLFRLLPTLFSLEWGGFIQYGVYGSPVISHWSEPVVSRILGHNR